MYMYQSMNKSHKTMDMQQNIIISTKVTEQH